MSLLPNVSWGTKSSQVEDYWVKMFQKRPLWLIVKQIKTPNIFMKSDRLCISLWILLDYDLLLCKFSHGNSSFAVPYVKHLRNPGLSHHALSPVVAFWLPFLRWRMSDCTVKMSFNPCLFRLWVLQYNFFVGGRVCQIMVNCSVGIPLL